MVPKRRVLGFLAFLSFFTLHAAMARPANGVKTKAKPAAKVFVRKAAGPQINSGKPVVLPSATAGKFYSVTLATLLSGPGTPPLTWTPGATMPKWLKLTSGTNTLSGTPAGTDAGTFNFTIGVSDSSGETADANHPISVTVFAPPVWTTDSVGNVDLGIQNEGTAWSQKLSSLVTDPTGGADVFTATGLPSWMTFNAATGILSGTPPFGSHGNYAGIALSATGKGGAATAQAYGTVLQTVRPPTWTSDNNLIANAKEDSAYSQSLSSYVNNPDGVPVTYAIVSQTQPNWLSIGSSTATLAGTPSKANVVSATSNPIVVSVVMQYSISGVSGSATANFTLNIAHTNHPPQWLANPISLPSASTAVSYSQPLGQSVNDPDSYLGGTLTYAIVSYTGPGTNWATINPTTGTLSGTPASSNAGTAFFTVSVTDAAGLSDTTTVTLSVIQSILPPYWLAHPSILTDAKEDSTYTVDLTQYAKDPSNKPMFFSTVGAPAWISVSNSGMLTGTPGASDTGIVKFQATVTDNLSGSDVTTIQFSVAHTPHPPYWVLNPVFTVNEDSALSAVSVAGYAKAKDAGDTLQFQLVKGPNWATLSTSGSFIGTPHADSEGDNVFTVRAIDQQNNLYADGTVTIHVNHINHPPSWTANPITVPNAKETTAYSSSIASYATDPDKGDVLTFSKVSGPSWLSVNTDGTLSGTPAHTDIGATTAVVRVADAAGATSDVTVKITVDKVNHPPRWRQNPIAMADGYDDTTYSFALSPYAVDDDGDALTFRLVSGPKWMFVGSAGDVTGVPAKADVGNFTAVFEVSDGSLTALATGNGQVIHKNHPPVVAVMPTFTVKERAVFTTSIAQYATDSDGDTMTFQLQGASSFVTLATNGDLAISPQFKDIGTHSLQFQVSDGIIPVYATLNINVIRAPQAPIWILDPMTFQAKSNEAFSDTLAGRAKDLDGIALTYAKTAGPAWVAVASNGALTGTPGNSDIGANTFQVTACNDLLCTTATVNISVVPGTQIDTVQVDTPVTGAPAENLWVVDNSTKCDKTIRELKKYIPVFFDTLNKAQIHHTGVFLSSDAHKWDGLPIRDSSDPMTFLWSQSNLVTNFNSRVDLAYSSGTCSNCYNSPIWAMHRFYERAPKLADIYQNGYFMPGVPVDALMITHQRDHFRWYTRNNVTYRDYEAADFAKEFVDFSAAQNQSYRISALAPECPALIEAAGDPSTVAPESAYRVLVDKTSGKYYSTSCHFDMKQTLTDYAQKIIFRAYVSAKPQIALTKTPIELSSIRVTIGGVVYSGNAGNANDVWLYDAATNKVIIRWYLIDLSKLKAGDLVSIEYRVS